MKSPEDGTFSPDMLSGLDETRNRVEEMIRREAEGHPHLDADALEIITMYVVGSLGAGAGRKGSDLDLIVALDYHGEVSADAQYDWIEYVQQDVEGTLKGNRSFLAEPLPRYIGYVDPKLGDTIDCNQLIGEMSSHGEYDRIYDVYDRAFMDAGRF